MNACHNNRITIINLICSFCVVIFEAYDLKQSTPGNLLAITNLKYWQTNTIVMVVLHATQLLDDHSRMAVVNI